MTDELADFPDQEPCTCAACVDACDFKPGWLAPGEAEKIAEHLGLTLQELFDKHLGIDWYTFSGEPTFVLAPATTRIHPGDMYGVTPMGRCVFFKDDRCSIHPVKPAECRKSGHRGAGADDLHKAMALSWKGDTAQAQLTKLRGYAPSIPESGPFERLSLLGDYLGRRRR